MNSRARAERAFTDLDVGPPSFAARAPGRVNLIGEHTDYNDGFVLPMALPFDTTVVGTWTGSQTISVASEGFPSATFQIGRAVDATVGWARYVHGMAALLADSGHPVNGWTGAIATDIPTGASLSSSAALEVATGLATLGPHFGIPPTEMARIGQRVENEIMGLPSGIMDQLASAGSVAGAATLIDCRDLTLRPVPLPEGVTVVVMDTGTRRELVGSEYADRRDSCMRAAAELRVASLRDATVADLRRLDAGVRHVERRRARHVITEIQRTLDAVEAMEGGDAVALGELMCASHASLRDDYEVSSPALDLIVDIAQRDPGCLGARMTGGGFAGGAIALVSTTAVDSFCAHVLQTFEAPPAQRATTPTRLYPVLPSAGASIDVLD